MAAVESFRHMGGEGCKMRQVLLLAALLAVSGCAQHRLVVARPNPTGEPIVANSSAFAFGTVQPRTVAECNTNLIDEVRIHQNLGQALVTVITLGLVMPTQIEYVCAKVPAESGPPSDE